MPDQDVAQRIEDDAVEREAKRKALKLSYVQAQITVPMPWRWRWWIYRGALKDHTSRWITFSWLGFRIEFTGVWKEKP